MASLASYINRQARNNLRFTSHEAEGINYVDIGRLLAVDIENCLTQESLLMENEILLQYYDIAVSRI